MSVKRICIIGNFSGRNAGDAAILGGLLEDVAPFAPDAVFDVPTINTGFVEREYTDYNVNAIGMMPWNLSVKILGLPLIRSIQRSDVILVTDAILFDRKLFNPLYNYLYTMSLVLPWARKKGKPVILYNVSLGPVSTPSGIKCLRKVIDASNEIIVRDSVSLDMMGVTGTEDRTVIHGADCALNVNETKGEALDKIFAAEKLNPEGKPFITVNINSYLDVFLKRGQRTTEDEFIRIMADTIDRMIETHGLHVVFVETQPMDLTLARKAYDAVKHQDQISMITNVDYSYRDLAGVFSRADIHIGMRTHSLILATAVGTPSVGIICTPKNRGFMKSIDQDARMIEFEDFTTENLFNLCSETWANRDALRQELEPIRMREKKKASDSAKLIEPYLTGRK